MNIRRYVVTVATTDDVDADEHVSADEIADFLSDYIGNSYANLVECQRISDLQIVDTEDGRFSEVPEQERPEKCTTVQEDTTTGVSEPEVPVTKELTEEKQATLDAQQHAELPPEPPAYGEADGDYPPLDVSKLNPPAAARWVAVDKSGLAYYYRVEPHCTAVGWHGPIVEHVYGRYDASNWQESIWPVNLDSPQSAHGEEDVSQCAQGKYPPLDVSKLNPPAAARWVAVDKSGRAYYYFVKPMCGTDSWHSPGYSIAGKAPGRYDASDWQEAIWPVNPTFIRCTVSLEQGS